MKLSRDSGNIKIGIELHYNQRQEKHPTKLTLEGLKEITYWNIYLSIYKLIGLVCFGFMAYQPL